VAGKEKEKCHRMGGACFLFCSGCSNILEPYSLRASQWNSALFTPERPTLVQNKPNDPTRTRSQTEIEICCLVQRQQIRLTA
jgi:hypothetical protein